MFSKSRSVLYLSENRLEHVEIVFHDLPLILGQVEQVVDRSIDIGFEGFEVVLLDFLAVGFEPVQQFDEVVVVPGDGLDRRVADGIRPPGHQGDRGVHVALHLGVYRVSPRLPLVGDIVEFSVVIAEVRLGKTIGLAIKFYTVHNLTRYHDRAREIVRGIDHAELPDVIVTNYVVAETLETLR